MLRILLPAVAFLFFFYAGSSQTVDPVKDWNLGIQLWTFNTTSFVTAIKKADSLQVKYVEAYPGQLLREGDNMVFGPAMSAVQRKSIKQLMRKKGMKIVSLGIIVARNKKDWERYFEFAADMQIPVIIAEPETKQLNDVNRLASAYNITVALHNNPVPDIYWHPDSVVRAIKSRGNIGVYADLGNWARSGLNPVDCIKKCSNRINEVHLEDVAEFGNPQARQVAPGEGVCGLAGVMQQLKRQDFTGTFIIGYDPNAGQDINLVAQYIGFFRDRVQRLK